MIYKCEWCGKKVEAKEKGLPAGWRILAYDSNKYTEEFDEAVVCSEDCEVRLARKHGAGGLR